MECSMTAGAISQAMHVCTSAHTLCTYTCAIAYACTTRHECPLRGHTPRAMHAYAMAQVHVHSECTCIRAWLATMQHKQQCTYTYKRCIRPHTPIMHPDIRPDASRTHVSTCNTRVHDHCCCAACRRHAVCSCIAAALQLQWYVPSERSSEGTYQYTSTPPWGGRRVCYL